MDALHTCGARAYLLCSAKRLVRGKIVFPGPSYSELVQRRQNLVPVRGNGSNSDHAVRHDARVVTCRLVAGKSHRLPAAAFTPTTCPVAVGTARRPTTRGTFGTTVGRREAATSRRLRDSEKGCPRVPSNASSNLLTPHRGDGTLPKDHALRERAIAYIPS
jgi:hypothetical protein